MARERRLFADFATSKTVTVTHKVDIRSTLFQKLSSKVKPGGTIIIDYPRTAQKYKHEDIIETTELDNDSLIQTNKDSRG